MSAQRVFTKVKIEDAYNAVLNALKEKKYSVLESNKEKIIAKHGLSAMYYPHEIEISLKPEGDVVMISARIEHKGGDIYLKRFLDELGKHLPLLADTPTLKPKSLTIPREEALKIFRDIIPKDVIREAEKVVGKPEFDALFNDKIEPLITEYMKKINNPNFNEGEEILWIHEVQKGIIHRETIEKWVITNLRALKIHSTTGEILTVGHKISDVVVMNQYRSSKGDRIGTFTGGYRHGIGAGVGYSTTRTTSTTYGDVVFLIAGREAFRFPGVSDPHGVKRLIESLKKAPL